MARGDDVYLLRRCFFGCCGTILNYSGGVFGMRGILLVTISLFIIDGVVMCLLMFLYKYDMFDL